MIAPREDSPVQFWMERLHPAVEHLREAGDVRHVRHREALGREGAGGAARRDELEAARHESAPEVDDSGLIRDAQQGSWHMGWSSSIIFWTPGGPGAERERPQNIAAFFYAPATVAGAGSTTRRFIASK